MTDKNFDFLYQPRPRKEIYQGRIINLGLETVKNADGDTAEFEIIRHPGGAVIACINDNNEICLIKQFRHAVDAWIWELPAGTLEPNEPPLKAAQREIIEETGFSANRWLDLGKIYSSPGVFNEVLHLYMAQELEQHEAQLEPHEFIEVHWVDINTAYQWAMDNIIADAKSIIAIFRCIHHINTQK